MLIMYNGFFLFQARFVYSSITHIYAHGVKIYYLQKYKREKKGRIILAHSKLHLHT